MTSLIFPHAPWTRTDEPLLWLSGFGHEVVTPATGYFHDSRKRPDPHLCLTLSLAGEGFYERRGVSTRLGPGMAFFDAMPGDFRYGYPLAATADFEFVWIDLVGPAAEVLWRRVIDRAGPVFDLGADNPVAPLMRSIVHQLAAGLMQDRYQMSARVYEVLMVMLSVLDRARLTTSPLVRRAVQAIHERGLRAGTDIGLIATQLGCAREHLTRAFAAAIGVSPGTYLLQHRLRRAQAELAASRDGLEAIARRCGFSGANYFCRVFREKIGITPQDFRSRPWVIKTGSVDQDADGPDRAK
ncbi:MAG: helix-turn-helix transcriptional regulator [Planctomycetes bacterium]|nr:helix-turn-helix transcriptional regulator [Planctomycetota bacterium]